MSRDNQTFGGPAMVGVAATEERHEKAGVNECASRHNRSTSGTFSSARSNRAAAYRPNR